MKQQRQSPDTRSIKILKLHWSSVEWQITCILDQLKTKKFNAVMGIPRGGLTPSVMISHELGIDTVALNIIGRSSNGDALLRRIEPIRFHSKILLIDDIADSGETLSFVKDWLRNEGFIVTTAALVAKEALKHGLDLKPDAVGQYIKADRWCLFPWENESKVKSDMEAYKKGLTRV